MEKDINMYKKKEKELNYWFKLLKLKYKEEEKENIWSIKMECDIVKEKRKKLYIVFSLLQKISFNKIEIIKKEEKSRLKSEVKDKIRLEKLKEIILEYMKVNKKTGEIKYNQIEYISISDMIEFYKYLKKINKKIYINQEDLEHMSNIKLYIYLKLEYELINKIIFNGNLKKYIILNIIL
jgi:hypothetical protein